MGVFDGIESASFFSRGKNIPEGKHVLRLRKMTTQSSTKKRSVYHFIAEFDVVESDSPDLRPGDVCSIVYGSDKESFLGNVKYFVSVYMFGLERQRNPDVTMREITNSITGAYIDTLVGDDGTNYAGMLIRCIGSMTVIKSGSNAGQPFTRLDWDTVDDKDQPDSEAAAPF